MINKLPEIGKRYRPTTNKPMSRNNIEITEAPRVSHTEGNMSLEFFLDNYEELPEDNSNQSKVERKTEVQVGYEFAKEDLEKELEQIDDSYFFNAEFATEDLLQKQLARLMDKSQNLLNALDNIKTQAKPVDNKIERKSEPQVNYEFNKEELEKEIEHLQSDDCFFKPKYASEDLLQKRLARLMDKAQCFVDACDDGEKNAENKIYWSKEQRSDCGRFRFKTGTTSTLTFGEKKKETKLPWKDVSELPTDYAHCLVKTNVAHKNQIAYGIFKFKEKEKGNTGFIDLAYPQLGGMNYFAKYCTLTDLINSIESMLSRQDELETRITKLEKR